MSAPHTAEFIQSKLDFFAAQMETTAASQSYSYDKGPVGEFALVRGKLESLKTLYRFWLDLGKEYYPETFTSAKPVEFWIAGLQSG